ncbi:MAG: hypothetical protein GQ535_03140 [Rhodobacteraceae bacterium]|nr:hypothetical protein [Paracoccaceae bacterium]
MTFSDEDITAYLDAELGAERRAAMDALIAASPSFAKRVAALELDTSALQLGFAPLLAEAPPVSLPQPRRNWAWAAMATAAVVLFAVGLAFGQLSKPSVESWQMEVAHYQVLYVPETLASIPPDTARLQKELARAESLLGIELDQVALSNVPGLTLRRAQVLGFEGRTLIQIAYTAQDGTPVAFCIMNGEGGGDSEMEFARLLGLETALWQGAKHGFMVIGGQDPTLISDSAQYLR